MMVLVRVLPEPKNGFERRLLEAREGVLDDFEALERRYQEEGELFKGAFIIHLLKRYGRRT